MSSAAAQRGRKRRRDHAHEGASSTRRRLGPSHFPAARSFGLRVALATAPHRRRRKRRVDGARHPVSTPRRGRGRSSLLPRVRHFPGLRPFALCFLLTTGASAPRRRRKPAAVDMGNYISRLLGKITSDGGLRAYKERIYGSPEVGDLTVEPELEPEKVDVVRRGIGDWSVPAPESSTPPQKRAPYCNETFDLTKRRDRRLQETGCEVKLQERKLAELPGVLAYRPKQDLSELFIPLTDEDEREVNTILHHSDHSDKIIVMHEPSNIEITKQKLQCLRPRDWLNDEVINLYIELLKERAEREPERFLKCHFFNTFFYKKIFVPVHRDIHWCLAVINMKDKTFQYLDSLGGLGHDVLRVLARYIMDELKDKSNVVIDTSSWVKYQIFSLHSRMGGIVVCLCLSSWISIAEVSNHISVRNT